MIDKFGLPKQKKCVVAFIDLLGISHKIEMNSKWTLDYIWLYYKFITKEIKNYENIKYKIFSDNILICKELDEKKPQQAICDVLAIVEKIEFTMMKIGALFVRGAVSIDDLHFSENFVYGKALLKTYKLECNVAKYPRIIIDEPILKIMNDKKLPIAKDYDNQFFYDFLQAKINQNEKQLSRELGTLAGNIIINLKTKNITSEIIKKMKWFINYYNSACAKNGLKQRITIETLTKAKIDTTAFHFNLN